MKDRYLHSITLKIVLKLKVFKKTIGPRWPNIVSLLNQAFTLPVPARKRKNEELMQNDEPQTVDDPCYIKCFKLLTMLATFWPTLSKIY